ncbi:hypothetical protein J437_LFUL011624 [Ladona fulva]|uniref:Uncharacterized protein n=1 Tax=Ladona fulva TaxID=123851 RepID=A0A8K0KCV4_LADFU|nr:hypothetical protein J437_LFUL011624 [Ladona fulva]
MIGAPTAERKRERFGRGRGLERRERDRERGGEVLVSQSERGGRRGNPSSRPEVRAVKSAACCGFLSLLSLTNRRQDVRYGLQDDQILHVQIDGRRQCRRQHRVHGRSKCSLQAGG